jgi:hypothetical protein
MQRRNLPHLVQLLFLFLAICALLFILRLSNLIPPSPYHVMLVGNLILLLATLASYFLYRRSMQQANIHRFIRAVYGSMLIKMMICISSLLVYVLFVSKAVSWQGLAGCFVFYCVYTFLEVKILMRLNKQPDHA